MLCRSNIRVYGGIDYSIYLQTDGYYWGMKYGSLVILRVVNGMGWDATCRLQKMARLNARGGRVGQCTYCTVPGLVSTPICDVDGSFQGRVALYRDPSTVDIRLRNRGRRLSHARLKQGSEQGLLGHGDTGYGDTCMCRFGERRQFAGWKTGTGISW